MTYYIEDTGIEFPVIEKNKQTSGGRQDDILYFIHRNLNSIQVTLFQTKII